MRSIGYFTTIAVCLSFFGCNVSTVHPLYSNDAAVSDPGLVGTWEMENGKVSLLISEDRDGYAIVVVTANRSPACSAKLVDLGGRRFCDCVSKKSTGPDSAPVHHVFRIALDADELRVGISDSSDVKTAVARNPPLTEYVINEGRFVLTGSTAQVQTFFRERGNDIFTKELKFRRR